MKRGVFITLEGNEGCGKSTQAKLLADYLKKQGHRVFLTREPGGTRIGDAIRQVLLDNKNSSMTSTAETLLYMASRAQLVDEEIKPRLRRGEVVICDRWLDATIAYQCYGGGIPRAWIESLGHVVTQDIKPDLTLFLDLPLEVGLFRAVSHKKADRMEKKQLSYHEKVRRGYMAIASKDKKRFKRIKIDPTDSIERVHEKIKQEAKHVLSKR